MIKWKRHAFNRWIGAVDEASNGKVVCLIDGFVAGNWMYHWTDDDIWVDDNKVECGRLCLHEFPRHGFSLGFGDIVSQDRIVLLNGLLSRCLFYCILSIPSSMGAEGHTGFQSLSV